MKIGRVSTASALCAAAATLILAACGGGGGSSSSAVTPAVTPGVTATSTPVAAVTPAVSGALTAPAAATANFADAAIFFSCGCTGQAGTETASSTGAFTITSPATAAPASPSPTYTAVPGRNYLIVGVGPTGAESWTMAFLGNTPATTLNLYSQADAVNVSDEYTTATALYVAFESTKFSGDQTFDHWNFNTLASFTKGLSATQGNNGAERQFLADIAAAQSANQSLFAASPLPAWAPAGLAANTTIAGDINAVAGSGDPSLPTPCPSSSSSSIACTNAPSP